MLDVKKSVAGKRIRKFFKMELDAYKEARRLSYLYSEKGRQGLVSNLSDPQNNFHDAVRAFLQKQETKSLQHYQKAKQVCGMLLRELGSFDVAARELDAWIWNRPVSETTKAGYYRYARMFWRWSQRMGYTDSLPIESVDVPKSGVRRAILSPIQMREILEADMPDWMWVVFLLGGFAGLRTIEMERISWDDVDFESGEIFIRHDVSKQSDEWPERIVEFTDPITKRVPRLRKICADNGQKLIPINRRNFFAARRRVITKLGWPKWPENCLRHSFATYHLGMSKNAATTAFQMGHTSPQMVQRVYAVAARRSEWQAWWRL